MSGALVPLAEPLLAGNEAAYVQEAIASSYVSSIGPFVERFERDFAAAVGAPHAVACTSGTAALHVALLLAGARPDALVAVSDFTFIASANAAAYTGARLLLVDSERASWNLDGELLHDEVVRRAKAGHELPAVIEAVHVLGHPARLEPLLELRERFGIALVEDAAEALGASWADRGHVGTAGDLGAFSFNGNKLVTTGGGGMIVTADPQLAERARHLTTQAKTTEPGYWHDEVGFNYRLTNVAAALGVAQLERLDDLLAAKRRIAARYDEELAGLEIEPAPDAPWARRSSWLHSVLVPAGRRDEVLAALAADGIGARPVWPPLHLQAPYRGVERLGGGVAEELFERGVSLPSSAGLTDADQDRAISVLRRVLAPR